MAREPFDFQKTIISQYDNAASLVQLITNFHGYINPSVLIDDFYRLIWNVDTAEGYGLDVWGRIVGVGRQLTIPDPGKYFGFSAAPPDWLPFDQAPFYAGAPLTDNFTLTDDAYRVLILVKAAANIARTDIPTLNSLMARLFAGRGRAYVNDLGSMQMRYTFEFYLEPYEFAIITNSGVLPRPTGVGAYLIQVPDGSTFGFQEAGNMQTFGHGTMFNAGALTNAS